MKKAVFPGSFDPITLGHCEIIEKACEIFDVIKMKNMYGKKVRGIERSTFLIDENGKLIEEWRKVKVADHVKEVLKKVKEYN